MHPKQFLSQLPLISPFWGAKSPETLRISVGKVTLVIYKSWHPDIGICYFIGLKGPEEEREEILSKWKEALGPPSTHPVQIDEEGWLYFWSVDSFLLPKSHLEEKLGDRLMSICQKYGLHSHEEQIIKETLLATEFFAGTHMGFKIFLFGGCCSELDAPEHAELFKGNQSQVCQDVGRFFGRRLQERVAEARWGLIVKVFGAIVQELNKDKKSCLGS